MAERSLVLIDVDKTAYRGNLIFSIIQQEATDGLIEQSDADKIFQIYETYKKGDSSYEEMVHQVVTKWAEVLKDKFVTDFLNHAIDFLNANRDKFYPYVSEVIQMVADTHSVYFVTAEPQFVARPIAETFGAIGAICSEMEVKDGKFTGKAELILSDRKHKLEAINHLFETHIITRSIAFGDSEGDIEMLKTVENPICINPNDGLKKVAEEKNWQVSDGSQETIDLVKNILNNL